MSALDKTAQGTPSSMQEQRRLMERRGAHAYAQFGKCRRCVRHSKEGPRFPPRVPPATPRAAPAQSAAAGSAPALGCVVRMRMCHAVLLDADAGQAPLVALLGAGQPQAKMLLWRRVYVREMPPARPRSIMLTPMRHGQLQASPHPRTSRRSPDKATTNPLPR